METFHKLFDNLLIFVNHLFRSRRHPRYIPLLFRPEHIVYLFRDVHGIYPITKQPFRKKTQDHQHWVQAYARNHPIPPRWPDQDMKKRGICQEDYARPYPQALERKHHFGVYFTFKSMNTALTSSAPARPNTQPKTPTQKSSTIREVQTEPLDRAFRPGLSEHCKALVEFGGRRRQVSSKPSDTSSHTVLRFIVLSRGDS